MKINADFLLNIYKHSVSIDSTDTATKISAKLFFKLFHQMKVVFKHWCVENEKLFALETVLAGILL